MHLFLRQMNVLCETFSKNFYHFSLYTICLQFLLISKHEIFTFSRSATQNTLHIYVVMIKEEKKYYTIAMYQIVYGLMENSLS